MKSRAAIIGAGLMGRWHATNIARLGGEVMFVCDTNEQAARSLAGNFKTAQAITQIEEALERNRVDVAHICTPLRNHFDSASAALERGIHVLVEKPMTNECLQTEQLYQLASKHQVLLCPVHQFSFQHGVQKALANLNRIGQLRHLEAIFCSAGGAAKRGEDLDEIVADILPHPLSLMQIFAPGSLRETNWGVHHPEPGELRATLNAHEISSSIFISMSARPTEAALRIVGTTGTIHVDLFHGFSVVEAGVVSRWRKIIRPFDLSLRTFGGAGINIIQRTFSREPAYPGLRTLIRNFYDAIASGSNPPIQSNDAIEIAATRDLLREKMKAD